VPHLKAAALPLLLLILAGCAGPAIRLPEPTDWAQHSARLQDLETWVASGKLALRTSERSESASVLWQQQGSDTRLQLSGPVGFNTTVIHSDGQHMEMRQGDTIRRWDISTPDAIARNTGWDLPLQALPYWLRGLPAPGTEVQLLELDEKLLHLQRLRQDDWEIKFESYENFGDFTLPTKLRIRRGDTSARMIIRDWRGLSA
jgi:outer membrane lipoprotein LolB